MKWWRRRPSEEDLASERFRQRNVEERAKGCPCGRPATHLRYGRGFNGSVPPEFYSCAEHMNTYGWSSSGDGRLVPDGDYPESVLEWVSPAYPIQQEQT